MLSSLDGVLQAKVKPSGEALIIYDANKTGIGKFSAKLKLYGYVIARK